MKRKLSLRRLAAWVFSITSMVLVVHCLLRGYSEIYAGSFVLFAGGFLLFTFGNNE